jgi:hypothetical protein
VTHVRTGVLHSYAQPVGPLKRGGQQRCLQYELVLRCVRVKAGGLDKTTGLSAGGGCIDLERKYRVSRHMDEHFGLEEGTVPRDNEGKRPSRNKDLILRTIDQRSTCIEFASHHDTELHAGV